MTARPYEGTPYDRLQLALGTERLERVRGSHVLVVGCGGVGSNCIEALVRGGVGRLTVIDCDVVEPTNLNRQAVAWQCTLGLPKAMAMQKVCAAINPDVSVEAVEAKVGEGNAAEIVAQAGASARIDYVVDAIDDVPAKLALVAAAQQAGLPVISSMGAANKYDPLNFRFGSIFETKNCGLSKRVRKIARAAGMQPFEVLYCDEAPHSLNPDFADDPAALGTMSYMPAIAGQLIASRVIARLVGAL